MSISKLATQPKVKPVVFYMPFPNAKIEVGLPAVVFAMNHPSHLIQPGDDVRTSTVLAYDEETGTFETRNSIYKLD